MAEFHTGLQRFLLDTAPEKPPSGEGKSTKTRELLRALVSEQFPRETELQQEIFEKYLPLADLLASPKTIAEFQALKKSLMELYDDGNSLLKKIFYKELFAQEPKREFYSEDEFLIAIGGLSPENFEKIIDSADWAVKIAAALKIFLLDKFNSEGPSSVNQRWYRIEGDKPKESKEVIVHENLEALLEAIQTYRLDSYGKPSVGRIGLVFGDFRVGSHSGHDKFLENAKLAVGKLGRLVLITPNSKTIISTTTKEKAWDDGERLHRLGENSFIDDLLMIDMPQKYWENPSEFWQMVWRAVQPELIFLGEKNHPLQPKYEEEAEQIGGILLIDTSPRIQSSENLLR